MPSALATIKALDATRPVLLPLVANPPVAELMAPPYWVEGCISTHAETNVEGAAALLAAAWCLTGGRRQWEAVMALLEAGGMSRAAARQLADRALQSLGEPTHAGVVAELRGELAAGVVAGWG
jgi:hypothetical protein